MSRTDIKTMLVFMTFALAFGGWRLVRARLDRQGPRGTAPGVLLSCAATWNSDSGMVYETVYAFKDEDGRDWKNATRALRYCLPRGTALVVEWPARHPERSYARPK